MRAYQSLPDKKLTPMTVIVTNKKAHNNRRCRRRQIFYFLLVLGSIYSYRIMTIIVIEDDENLHLPMAEFDLSIIKEGVARAKDQDFRPTDTTSFTSTSLWTDYLRSKLVFDDDMLDEELLTVNSTLDSVDDDFEDWSEDKATNSNGVVVVVPEQERIVDDQQAVDPSKLKHRAVDESTDTIPSTSVWQQLWRKVAHIWQSDPGQTNDYHDNNSPVKTRPSTGQRKPYGLQTVRKMNITFRTPQASVSPQQVEEKIQELLLLYPETCRDKERYLKIVLSANDSRSQRWAGGKGESLCKSLPTHRQIVDKYGEKPVIVGLETCQVYRDLLAPEHNHGTHLEPKPRVAGLYHSGTNALCRSFDENIRRLSRKKFSPYEIPWGKHLPPAVHRLNNTFPEGNAENKFRVLPIVIVRDPFFWFQSMCKVRYDAKWEKEETNRCPNFVRYSHNKTTWPVRCSTHQTNYKKVDHYNSLADMWNDWNLQYLDADYPRLMIRFEDTLYRLEEVVNTIRECIGMSKRDSFIHKISRAKQHGNPTDFVAALTKQVSTVGRHRGLNADDRKYAHEVLSSRLMNTFGYEQCPLEVDESDLEGPFRGWVIKDNPDGNNPANRLRSKFTLSKFGARGGEQAANEREERARQRREEVMERLREVRAAHQALLRERAARGTAS